MTDLILGFVVIFFVFVVVMKVLGLLDMIDLVSTMIISMTLVLNESLKIFQERPEKERNKYSSLIKLLVNWNDTILSSSGFLIIGYGIFLSIKFFYSMIVWLNN